MNNHARLIKIQVSKGGKQVISARELHQFLGVKTNVNTWFKNQIERAMLEEGKDFIQTFEESTGKTFKNKITMQELLKAQKMMSSKQISQRT